MKRLIVCVIDDDIIEAVRANHASDRRATYDISVVRALKTSGARVQMVAASEPAGRTLCELMDLKPDVIFNLAFSATPAESAFAGALEMLGCPFTGSGGVAIALANDKLRMRQLLDRSAVRVPDYVMVTQPNQFQPVNLCPPFLVKPVCLANSLGIRRRNLAPNWAAALKESARIGRRFQVPTLCDRFIVGREFQVGLVEALGRFQVTSIVELHFAGAPTGYGFKTEAIYAAGVGHRDYEITVRRAVLSPGQRREMAIMACMAANALDLRGYAKIDLRLDQDGQLFVLEVNANPGLWSKSLLWNRGGFGNTLRKIVAAAHAGSAAFSRY